MTAMLTVALARLRAIGRVARQVAGMPDYDRYVEHMTAHHPGERVMSRREFTARSIERKYSASGPRCC